MNQAAVARKLGVSRQAVQQYLRGRGRNKEHQAIVAKTMTEMIDKIGVTDERLAREGLKGLRKRAGHIHHKYWITYLEMKKHIKADEENKGINLTIRYGHRKKPTVDQNKS